MFQLQPYQFSFPADIFGFLGIIASIVIYQQRKNNHMLYWKLICDAVWIVYYILRGNYSVVAITVVAIFRSIVLLCHDHKWARSKLWLPGFMLISVIFSIIAWKDWTSLLTMISSLICISMYWLRSPKMVRILTIPASALFLVNVFVHFDWMGVLSETFLLISAIVGFIRIDLIHKKDVKEC